MRLRPAIEAVDHLLLATPDLDLGIRWVQERTGVKPAQGGTHPGRGTRNALLSLGNRHYLEVIAPDPAQATIAPQYRDLASMAAPGLFTWAVNTTEIDAVADRLRKAQVKATAVLPGSRTKPNGETLAWKALNVDSSAGLLVPFFIQWSGESVHPSQDSPSGCTLRALRFEHPDAAMVHAVLEQLGLNATVTTAAKPALVAMIATPHGEVELR